LVGERWAVAAEERHVVRWGCYDIYIKWRMAEKKKQAKGDNHNLIYGSYMGEFEIPEFLDLRGAAS
jgi:hypothetical protein